MAASQEAPHSNIGESNTGGSDAVESEFKQAWKIIKKRITELNNLAFNADTKIESNKITRDIQIADQESTTTLDSELFLESMSEEGEDLPKEKEKEEEEESKDAPAAKSKEEEEPSPPKNSPLPLNNPDNLAVSIRAGFWLLTALSPELALKKETKQLILNLFNKSFLENIQDKQSKQNKSELKNRLYKFRKELLKIIPKENREDFEKHEKLFTAQTQKEDSGELSSLRQSPIITNITEAENTEQENTEPKNKVFSIESKPLFPLRPTQLLKTETGAGGEEENNARNAYKETITCEINNKIILKEDIREDIREDIKKEKIKAKINYSDPAKNKKAYDSIISENSSFKFFDFNKEDRFIKAIIFNYKKNEQNLSEQNLSQQDGVSQQNDDVSQQDHNLKLKRQAKLFSWAIENDVKLGVEIASEDKALYLAALAVIENEKSLIYCKSGKDRTALVATLIQAMIKTYAETGTLIDLAEPIFDTQPIETEISTIEIKKTYYRSGCCTTLDQIRNIKNKINTDLNKKPKQDINLNPKENLNLNLDLNQDLNHNLNPKKNPNLSQELIPYQNQNPAPIHFIHLCDTNLLAGDGLYGKLAWDTASEAAAKPKNNIKILSYCLQRQSKLQKSLDFIYRQLTWHNDYIGLNKVHNFIIRDVIYSAIQIAVLLTALALNILKFIISAPFLLSYACLKYCIESCSKENKSKPNPNLLKNINIIAKSGHNDFLSGWLGGTLGCFSLMNMKKNKTLSFLSFLNLKQAALPKNMEDSFTFKTWGGWRFANAGSISL